MNVLRRCVGAIAIGLGVFLVMQLLAGTKCFDCGTKIGFPFHYMQEGTYGTVGHFIWLGFLGDCAIAISLAILITWTWHALRTANE